MARLDKGGLILALVSSVGISLGVKILGHLLDASISTAVSAGITGALVPIVYVVHARKNGGSSKQIENTKETTNKLYRMTVSLAIIPISAISLSCNSETPLEPNKAARTFLFVSHDIDPPEQLVVRTTIPEVIKSVLAELTLPEHQRRKILHGKIVRGAVGYNRPWSWHLHEEQWRLVDAAIEICDARPSDVERGLDEWIERVGVFCPWGLYLKTELTSDIRVSSMSKE